MTSNIIDEHASQSYLDNTALQAQRIAQRVLSADMPGTIAQLPNVITIKGEDFTCCVKYGMLDIRVAKIGPDTRTAYSGRNRDVIVSHFVRKSRTYERYNNAWRKIRGA